MHRLLKIIAGVALVLAVSGGGAPIATAQSSFSSSGVPGLSPSAAQRKVVEVPGGQRREYLIDLPRGYDSTRDYPVVLGFGGWQHTAERFRSFGNLSTYMGADAIIVYPEGINQAWEGAPYASTGRGEDVSFVRAVVDDLAAQYRVDRSRVYATGLSNGGGMAVALACQAPDLVSAVVSVAGAYYAPTVNNCAPGSVATMIIHGEADDVVDINGGIRHGQRYVSAQAVFDQFADRNSCTGVPSVRRDMANSTVVRGENCLAETAFATVTRGGHTWFPNNPDAAAESWRFFQNN